MTIHLLKEIEKTEKSILSLTAYVEQALRKSIQAFEENNKELAKEVIAEDQLIDQMEIDVEEECLKVLALHQPVASDLRFIIAAIRMTSDLERIGDHAVSIAKRTLSLLKTPNVVLSISTIKTITDTTVLCLNNSIQSLITRDVALAQSVLAYEPQIVELKKELFKKYLTQSKEDPQNIEAYSQYMFVSRYLERIADHAFNIAEDVIYMVEGKIVRHQ